MIYQIPSKIILYIISFVMIFSRVNCKLPEEYRFCDIEVTYSFDNDNVYSAAGTVSVTGGDCDFDYDLYWGDENGEILKVLSGGVNARYSEFATVSTTDGFGSTEINDFTAIPGGAEQVLVCIGSVEVAEYDLPKEKQPAKEKPLYRFGALSDVHFNRYHNSLTDDAMVAFPNALNFLDAFGVKLVGISGDISTNAETNAFIKYNTVASDYDFPVYTCTGNHDVDDDFSLSDWNKYMNTGVYSARKADGVVDVADNNLDFVYAPDGEDGDIFIFLSQYRWDYNKETSRILTDAQLDWLEDKLDKYSDNTVFLFFHTFLENDDEENPHMGVGNVINSAGTHYSLAFTRGTPDEARFRSLLKEYKNVVFFSGHSHLSYDMQRYNEQLNISDYGGEYCTLVHVSSVTAPRTVTEDSDGMKSNSLIRSEGYLVNVYPDRIELIGVDFYMHEFLSYASYIIER